MASIDAASGAVKQVFPRVRARPWGVASDPSGRKLYTANGPSHDVSVIDVSQGRVLERIRVGRSPWGVVFASIVEGRPNGMPSYRGKLTEPQVWPLASYVRALGGIVALDAQPGRSDTLSGARPRPC